MQDSTEIAFDRAAEQLGAKKLLHIEIPQREGDPITVYVVGHATSGRVALLLSRAFQPIEFDTPMGKQFWIRSWALLNGQNIFAIEDGPTESLGLYSFRGVPATLSFNSPFNTVEVFYRIRRAALSKVDDDMPFLLRPSLSSLFDMPALGPE